MVQQPPLSHLNKSPNHPASPPRRLMIEATYSLDMESVAGHLLKLVAFEGRPEGTGQCLHR
jgi:hypothetical protein